MHTYGFVHIHMNYIVQSRTLNIKHQIVTVTFFFVEMQMRIKVNYLQMKNKHTNQTFFNLLGVVQK